jgi:hypothetical protein
MPRFNKVIVGILGQSQAYPLCGSASFEHWDDVLAGSVITRDRFQAVLSALMPGVTVQMRGRTISGAPAGNYTSVASTALIRSLHGSEAWWNDTVSPSVLDTHGTAVVNHVNETADPAALYVLIHYCHTGDAQFTSWNPAIYAVEVGKFYDAVNAACAASYGEFRVLPVVNGSRTNSNDQNLGEARMIFEALAGQIPPQFGATARPYMLRPVSPGAYVPIGAYLNGSSDFAHLVKSTNWRAINQAAVRIAGWNGAVPPGLDQPRLARAVRLTITTIRAYIVSPARLPLRAQGTGIFRASPGTITAVSAIDNAAVAATGYATVDLTFASPVSGGARLLMLDGQQGFSEFANGRTAPRGAMTRAFWADPGSVTALTDNAEDIFAAVPVMHAASNDYGVPIEIP